MSGERYTGGAAGPLAGVRVLDMTHHLAGAWATLKLADLGADVIKVERPGGEGLRAMDVEGLRPFDVLNRGKRSVVVDLRHPDGPPLVRSVLAEVDVFVENFRPGVLERFGLGYGQLGPECDHLVYCSITGYGAEAPHAGRPGFDLGAQALGGIMVCTGDRGGPPVRAGVPLTSIGAGMLAVGEILAAHAARLAGGRGRRVTTSLLDAARAFALLEAARPPGGERLPLTSPEGTFRTRDGWIVVSAGEEPAWRALCALLERPDLAADERFATAPRRRAHHGELSSELAGAFAAGSTDEWIARLDAAGIGCAPVRDVEPALAHGDVPAPGRDTRRALEDLDVPPARIADLLARAAVAQAPDGATPIDPDTRSDPMPQPDYQHLRWEVQDTIATVWLSRPPVNAVDQPMYREIQRLFSHLDELGPDIRAVVLAADGRHFCAGNELDDFETLTPDNSRERMFNAREAFWAIRECPVPVIAAVHGMALGTGCAITCSCDVVIAAEDARIGLPEIKVGVMGGGKHLSRLLPQGLVRYMFFTGEPLPATEFVRFGGVLKVVAPDALLEEAQAIARSIARHSPVALRAAKRGLNEIEYLPLKQGYELEQGLTGELSAHPHAKEALRAFRERREPDYAGTAATAA